VLLVGPTSRQGIEKISLQTHFKYSPPRKSLVKGERFISDQGDEEVLRYGSREYYVELDAKSLVGQEQSDF